MLLRLSNSVSEYLLTDSEHSLTPIRSFGLVPTNLQNLLLIPGPLVQAFHATTGRTLPTPAVRSRPPGLPHLVAAGRRELRSLAVGNGAPFPVMLYSAPRISPGYNNVGSGTYRPSV
jgi:hypothetical protein